MATFALGGALATGSVVALPDMAVAQVGPGTLLFTEIDAGQSPNPTGTIVASGVINGVGHVIAAGDEADVWGFPGLGTITFTRHTIAFQDNFDPTTCVHRFSGGEGFHLGNGTGALSGLTIEGTTTDHGVSWPTGWATAVRRNRVPWSSSREVWAAFLDAALSGPFPQCACSPAPVRREVRVEAPKGRGGSPHFSTPGGTVGLGQPRSYSAFVGMDPSVAFLSWNLTPVKVAAASPDRADAAARFVVRAGVSAAHRRRHP